MHIVVMVICFVLCHNVQSTISATELHRKISKQKGCQQDSADNLDTLHTLLDNRIWINSPDKNVQNWKQLVDFVQQKQAYTYECPSCGSCFDTQDQSASCYARHWEQGIFSCSSCTYGAQSKNELDDHFKREHMHLLDELPYREKLRISCELLARPCCVKDIHIHNINRDLQSMICCNTVLTSWLVAQNHFSSYHRHENRSFDCITATCKQRHYTAAQALECYLCNRKSSIFQCVFCKQSFNTRDQLIIMHVLSGCTMYQRISNQPTGDK